MEEKIEEEGAEQEAAMVRRLTVRLVMTASLEIPV